MLGRRFAMFLIVGLLNTGVGVTIIAVGILLGLRPLVANALGFACGLCVSFLFNSRLTFRGGSRDLSVFARYILAFLIAYGCNVLTVVLLDFWFPSHVLITTALGIVPYMIVFFVLAQYFVFGSEPTMSQNRRSSNA